MKKSNSNTEQRNNIIRALSNLGVGYKKIAERFSISPGRVKCIITGRVSPCTVETVKRGQKKYFDKYKLTDAYKHCMKISRSKWWKSNNGKLYSRIKRHRRVRALNTLSIVVVQHVYEENIKKYGTLTCELCFKPIEFGQDSIEHFHPVARTKEYIGDINERKNLGVAHDICNSSKGKKTLIEWLAGNKEL